MYISVSQRRRQIGILKSMGASNAFVVTTYLIESCCYGVIAYAIGVFLYATMYAYSFLHPLALPIGDFRLVINSLQLTTSFVVLICAVILGGILPALMAVRTNIIDVLRNTI